MSSHRDARTGTHGRGYSQETLKVGVRSRPLADVYHFLLTSSWPVIFALILCSYLAANVLFAILYLADGGIDGARPGNFEDAFFFSVQTMSTIGYGRMVPTSTFANAVVTLEALFGLVTLALGTSLMFSKFSQPHARVIFSRNAVVTIRDGATVLMVRLANERSTGLVEAQLRLVLVRDETTLEGEAVRRFHTLTLSRSASAVFALSWTAIHVIDESSPLFGETRETLVASRADVAATLVGIEEATTQQVHARYTWRAQDILFDHRFRDILKVSPEGRRLLDYRLFHDVEPAPARGDGRPSSERPVSAVVNGPSPARAESKA
jgi:inward rectifier potassium channel